jgi:capsular exopolysaccharide synthesis family protein
MALLLVERSFMDLREVISALREAWWLPIIGLILGGGAALGASLLQTPLYASTTQFFVSTSDTTSASDYLQGSQFSQQRVTSYSRLVTGEELAGRVIERLALDVTPEELSSRITATAVTDTVLIDVTVTDPSPEQAQRVAAAVGDEFAAFVSELETPARGATSPVRVTVTDRPEVPEAPSSPEVLRNLLLGLLTGLLIGAVVAIVRSRLDRSVKDADQTAVLVGAPVIGTVMRDDALRGQHTFDRRHGNRTAEDYRQLRNNLRFLKVDQPPKVIMVSSALPSEGKTTLVINLGLALADAGQRVTIVEADLRRPKVTRYLGLLGGVGLINVLDGSADLEDVTQTHADGLSVIASGPRPPNPGELLASGQLATLLNRLRENNDLVLVDAAPLLPVADATGLAAAVDGVLLSVRYGSTKREELQQAALTLRRVGASVLGVVLNMVPPGAEEAAAYGYQHRYEETGPHVEPRPTLRSRRGRHEDVTSDS